MVHLPPSPSRNAVAGVSRPRVTLSESLSLPGLLAPKQDADLQAEAEAVLAMQRAAEVGRVTRSAFMRRETGTLNQAFKFAKNAGMPAEALEAKRLLAQAEAQKMLSAAIHKRHIGRLREAIEWAEGCGLESRDLDSARRLLAHDEVHRLLNTAIVGKNSGLLEEVICKGKVAGMETECLAKAARVLAQIRARDARKSPIQSPSHGGGRQSGQRHLSAELPMLSPKMSKSANASAIAGFSRRNNH